jgi:hypothetical protein
MLKGNGTGQLELELEPANAAVEAPSESTSAATIFDIMFSYPRGAYYGRGGTPITVHGTIV